MLITITGITGLVGSELARQALEKGYKVRGLVRANSLDGIEPSIRNKIEISMGDMVDYESVEEALTNADYVIHCAAMVSFNESDRYLLETVNTIGTRNVVNAALATPSIKRLIHIGSIATYAKPKNGIEVSEENTFDYNENASHYGRTKFEAELEVWRGKAEGLDIQILDPSVILGYGRKGHGSTRLVDYVLANKPFYTQGTINYIDVTDVAKIALLSVEKKLSSEKYILSAGHMPLRTFFTRMAQALNKRPPFIFISPIMSQVAWRLLWLIHKFTGIKPFITRETANTANRPYIYLSSKFLAENEYSFSRFDQSLEKLRNQISDKIK